MFGLEFFWLNGIHLHRLLPASLHRAFQHHDGSEHDSPMEDKADDQEHNVSTLTGYTPFCPMPILYYPQLAKTDSLPNRVLYPHLPVQYDTLCF